MWPLIPGKPTILKPDSAGPPRTATEQFPPNSFGLQLDSKFLQYMNRVFAVGNAQHFQNIRNRPAPIHQSKISQATALLVSHVMLCPTLRSINNSYSHGQFLCLPLFHSTFARSICHAILASVLWRCFRAEVFLRAPCRKDEHNSA